MASRREFKKDLNQVLSEVIEECYAVQLMADDKTAKKAEKLIDDAIGTFDELIGKVHQKDVENTKAHFRSLREELEKSTASMYDAINKLKS